MWIFKNKLGQIYTQMIDTKEVPGYHRVHYFQGFDYKFEDPSQALGMIVVCNREPWLKGWIETITEMHPEIEGLVAVKLIEAS